MTSKSSYIPLFPLDIFLLPGEQLPLHVFEPRYKQLFDEIENDGTLFGLPFKSDKLGNKVCMCKLLKVTKRYRSGERDVVVEAMSIHVLDRWDDVHPGKLYPGGAVGRKVDHVGNMRAPVELVSSFADYIEKKYGNRPDYASLHKYSIGDIAACISLSNEDKMAYLMMVNDDQRLSYLERMLRYLLFLYEQEEKSENGILLN